MKREGTSCRPRFVRVAYVCDVSLASLSPARSAPSPRVSSLRIGTHSSSLRLRRRPRTRHYRRRGRRRRRGQVVVKRARSGGSGSARRFGGAGSGRLCQDEREGREKATTRTATRRRRSFAVAS